MPNAANDIYLRGLAWELSDRYVSRGDDSGAIVMTGTSVQTDPFGVDMLTLPVNVRTDLVGSFLPQIGQLDPIYKKLRYVERSLTHGANWRTTINVKFEGFLDDLTRNRNEEAVDSLNERTVTLRNGSEITITVTYMAPGQTWEYAAEVDPLEPRHREDIQVSTATFEITEIRTSTDVALTGLVDLADLEAAGYLFTTAVRTTGFSRKRKKNGAVCRITEQNEAMIIATF